MRGLLPAALSAAAVLVHGLPAPTELRLRRLGLRSPSGAAAAACQDGSAMPPAWLVAAAAAVGGLLLVGPAGLALGLGAALGLIRLQRVRAAARAADRERARLPEALGVLSAELRAGRPVAEALDGAAAAAVGVAAVSFAAAAAALRWGADPEAALSRPGSAVTSSLMSVGVCLRVCGRSGSGLADAVDRLADGCRAQEEQRRAVEVGLAGPRATATLLAGLPAAGIGLAALLGADPLQVLLRTPVGLACLVLGLGLDLLGLVWARRIAGWAAGSS